MSGIEILGIAASVLQIADLGGILSVDFPSSYIPSLERLKDIAATGAVLQQLASVLEKDEKLRLCSDQAIEITKGLVADCKQIFSELDDALDNRTTGNKYISAWKDRLKFPCIELQIDLLQSNLERLKSSLVVMLNVLVYAEQLRK
ncbi:uncharacterized protein A1O9_11304 [Exophiala aquamarina CBS 119918]|uniref:Fungal N-terminal domain-containing protein n=1 Tax=Exophiala aquamarina CBS 119918 TaxID=1182545 RepID=A0A072NYH3_9EURO|nr:uncharacterized protein A1O9_11304 [Exophiala aquamarina CBS 119918]KEF52462.1 hypothetical protein A1O9_11304 [Exophiala aquamarina CBS 119918]